MSQNILQSIARVRELLGGPKAQKPSLQSLYGAVVRNFQDMYNVLSNTDESWTFQETDIETASGQDTYEVSPSVQPAFGKPLLLTTYSTEDSAIERAIPFYDIQNLKFDWFLPANFQGWTSFPTGGDHSAQRASFFYDANGLPKIRITPTPQSSTTYRLKFSIGNWADSANVGASAILASHHHLFEVRSAKDTIYLAEWPGIASLDDARKFRREIRESLDEMEFRYLPQFTRYVKEMTHDGITFLKAWDE